MRTLPPWLLSYLFKLNICETKYASLPPICHLLQRKMLKLHLQSQSQLTWYVQLREMREREESSHLRCRLLNFLKLSVMLISDSRHFYLITTLSTSMPFPYSICQQSSFLSFFIPGTLRAPPLSWSLPTKSHLALSFLYARRYSKFLKSVNS